MRLIDKKLCKGELPLPCSRPFQALLLGSLEQVHPFLASEDPHRQLISNQPVIVLFLEPERATAHKVFHVSG